MAKPGRPGYCKPCMREYSKRYWIEKDPKRWTCPACDETRARYVTICPCAFPACEFCGKKFRHIHAGKLRRYCSDICRATAHHAANPPKPKGPPPLTECTWCFVAFVPVNRSNRHRHCTNTCRDAARQHYVLHRAPDRCHIPQCRQCASPIPLRRSGYTSVVSLCVKCSNANRAKGRGKMRLPDGRVITPDDIAARDGWACHLCGRDINPHAHRNAAEGATLDHVIPMVLGGQHVLGNLRLAHRSCNSRKGARVLPSRRKSAPVLSSDPARLF